MRNRGSRDIIQPHAHTFSPITSFRALSALPFSRGNFHFSSTMPHDEARFTRNYDSVLNFMRIRPGRGGFVKKKEEEKCTRRFTEFLEQCEIKATFNCRQCDASVETSNFLIRLFVRDRLLFI